MGTDNGGGLQARVELEDDQARISLDAVGGSGEPINGLHPLAAVVPPGRRRRRAREPDADLRQTAPGHYEATFPVGAEGAYLVRVQTRDTRRAPGAARRRSASSCPTRPNTALLPGDTACSPACAATRTGARWRSTPPSQAAVFRHDLPPVSRADRPLALAPADRRSCCCRSTSALRRVLVGWRDLPRFLGKRRVAGCAPAPAPVVPGDASATAALGPLFEARRRRSAARRPPPPARSPGAWPATARRPPRLRPGRSRTRPPAAASRSPAAPPTTRRRAPAAGAAGGNIAGEVLRRRKTRDG